MNDIGISARFPSDFVWGTATAAYQIEGAASEGGRGSSIWDTFSHTPGKTANGDTGDVAVDHYHRLESDLDLLAAIGVSAYRFSISWPRVQPTGRGPANPVGLDFYNRLIDGLLSRGIAPVATLYHWDLPQELEDEGGWTARTTAEAFGDYARIAAVEFGDRIKHWSTLNEPWCSAFNGYGSGRHAPGVSDPEAALRAAHHLNLAHGIAVAALRKVLDEDTTVSVVLNLHAIRAEAPEYAGLVRRLERVGNEIFTGPILRGEYPQQLFADTAEITDWSFVLPGDLEVIHRPIDALGINYYSSRLVRPADPADPRVNAEWPACSDIEFVDERGEATAMGWNVDPEAFRRLILDVSDAFPDLPLFVSENGAAYADAPAEDGAIHDPERISYVRRHLDALAEAIDAGAQVQGYFLWSFLDNFEWAYGYEKRFGIVFVDYDTLERTPKDSARWYGQVIRANAFSAGAGRR